MEAKRSLIVFLCKEQSEREKQNWNRVPSRTRYLKQFKSLPSAFGLKIIPFMESLILAQDERLRRA